ncbi:MAG: hypothetical protein LBS86_06550 [Treponema sp.]|jgi:hypothetical protein|nr:hypothetical protein [Treponema sp.]
MDCHLRLEDHRGASGLVQLYEERHAKRLSRELKLTAESYYRGSLSLSHVEHPIARAELFLNNMLIGEAAVNPQLMEQNAAIAFYFTSEEVSLEKTAPTTAAIRREVVYQSAGREAQPFLLRYDLVHFSLALAFVDGELRYYESDEYVCTSRSVATAENVLALMTSLSSGGDDTVNHWIYGNDMREALWQTGGQRALANYIDLLNAVYQCYDRNYVLFSSNVRHKIAKENFLQSYSKLRSINMDSLHWLFKNSDRLARVSGETAIQIDGHSYLPYQMPIETAVKSFDIYENRLVLGFLLWVYRHGRDMQTRIEQSIEEEEALLAELDDVVTPGDALFIAPIREARRIQLRDIRALQERLYALLPALASQYTRYREILPCREVSFFESGLPKKTKIFQEVRAYRQVFEQILAWYHFSGFDLLRECVFSSLKKLDTIFEQYCLRELLHMSKDAGFQLNAPPHYFEYRRGGAVSALANTYELRRGNERVTVYYTPCINSDGFENEIGLFRTTNQGACYTPDFVFKLESSASRVAFYVIMDAKYSTRSIIKDNYLHKTIFKYACELADAKNKGQTIRMVWILEGRIDDIRTFDALEWLHNSPLAAQFRPPVSYGIAAINGKTTKTTAMQTLWREIEAIIAEL